MINREDYQLPPKEGFVLTHFLTVTDVKRSAEFYQRILGGHVIRSVEFLTESKDHGSEIRCYMRDPDDYIIEVGQTTGGLIDLAQG
jgi:hypothetical protein